MRIGRWPCVGGATLRNSCMASPSSAAFCDGFTSPTHIEQTRLVDNKRVWPGISETGIADA
jgi:hypothetical protein